MQSVEPAPEPTGDGSPRQEPHGHHDELGIERKQLDHDRGADFVWRLRDGTVVQFDVKQTRRRSVDNLRQRIARWRQTAWPTHFLSEQEAQSATASAVLYWFVVLLNEQSAETVSDTIKELEQATGQTGQLALRQNLRHCLDRHVFAIWLVPPPIEEVQQRPGRIVRELPTGTGKTELSLRLAQLLSYWHDVGKAAPAFQAEALRWCAADAAEQVSAAALAAREALLTEPWELSKHRVTAFARKWLGIRPTPGLLEATASALLYAPLDDFDPDDDRRIIDSLKKDVQHQHNLSRLIGETQLRGKLVDYLDRPMRVACDGERVPTIGDTLILPDPTDALVAKLDRWSDPRLGRVLAQLKPDEYRVAMAYAAGPVTWSEAAFECGLPEQFGERVRRKLHRLGKQTQERIAAHSSAHWNAA